MNSLVSKNSRSGITYRDADKLNHIKFGCFLCFHNIKQILYSPTSSPLKTGLEVQRYVCVDLVWFPSSVCLSVCLSMAYFHPDLNFKGTKRGKKCPTQKAKAENGNVVGLSRCLHLLVVTAKHCDWHFFKKITHIYICMHLYALKIGTLNYENFISISFSGARLRKILGFVGCRLLRVMSLIN